MTTFNAINNALPELTINSTTTVNGIINDGTMATASATNLSTSSAIKTYVGSLVGTGGALNYLATLNASTSTAITFNGYFTSSYDVYVITLDNIIPTTTNTLFYLNLGTGGTPTIVSANYTYNTMYGYNGSTSAIFSTSASQVICTNSTSGVDSSGLFGTIYLFGMNTSSNPGLGLGEFTYAHTEIRTCVGFTQPAAIFTAIQFTMSSGTIASGTFKLYGIKNS